MRSTVCDFGKPAQDATFSPVAPIIIPGFVHPVRPFPDEIFEDHGAAAIIVVHRVTTTQQPTETVPQNTKRHSFVTANRTSRSGKGNALCSRANGAYFGRPAWLNVFEAVNSPVPSKGTLAPPRPLGQEPSVTITKGFSPSASEPVSRLPTVITVWTTLKRVARLQGVITYQYYSSVTGCVRSLNIL